MPINNRQLENGITLISEPVAATKAAAIGFWFSTGSRDENADVSGITHFIEHMLFKGTGNHSARDIARFFDRTGGYVNAFTDRELVCLYAVVPGKDADGALGMMVEMLAGSRFSPVDIETERSVIESEILSYLDDPEESCAEWFMETSFSGSGLSRPIAGTVESLNGISRESLVEYQHGHFLPKLACVTVSGSFNEDSFIKILSRYPRVEEFKISLKGTSDLIDWHPGKKVKKTRFSQSQIALGWKIPLIRTTEEWFDWSSINDILSDTVSSRLFQELREERGLCYSISGTVNVLRDFSFLGINVSVPPEKTLESIEALNEFTLSFFATGPTEAEVTDIKSRETGAITLAAEDSEYRMKRLAHQFFRDTEVQSVEEDLGIVKSISADRLFTRLSPLRGDAECSFLLCAPGKFGKLFIRE